MKRLLRVRQWLARNSQKQIRARGLAFTIADCQLPIGVIAVLERYHLIKRPAHSLRYDSDDKHSNRQLAIGNRQLLEVFQFGPLGSIG